MYDKKKKKRRVNTVAPYSNEQWELEEDLRALTRSEAVRADPARLKKVKELAKSKLDEFQRKKDEAQEGINLAAEK